MASELEGVDFEVQLLPLAQCQAYRRHQASIRAVSPASTTVEADRFVLHAACRALLRVTAAPAPRAMSSDSKKMRSQLRSTQSVRPSVFATLDDCGSCSVPIVQPRPVLTTSYSFLTV